MEARLALAALLAAAALSLGAQFRTPNFVVNAPTPELARQVGRGAEKYRRELAVAWLGKTMPNWSRPCPIKVRVAPNLGAGGVTSFLFDRGEVYGWRMNIQGPQDRLMDSVLPHEVTHTIFASHFRQPLPRWADEGACTTVEHESERAKQQQMLIQFLKTGRGISFSQMFALKEYPHDVMPLYSQGYSLASFLIDHGGRAKFLAFVSDGLQEEHWTEATRRHYGYPSLAALQDSWLDWVRQGSPLRPQTPDSPDSHLLASKSARRRAQSDLVYRGQSEDPPGQFAGNLVDVRTSEGASSGVTSSHDVGQGDTERKTKQAAPPAPRAGAPGWQPKEVRRGSYHRAGLGTSASAAESAIEERTDAVDEATPPISTPGKPRRTLLEWDRDAERGDDSPAASPLFDASAGEVRVLR